MRTIFCLSLLAVLCLPAAAQATVIISAGFHDLVHNTANQIVDVMIQATAGESINSIDAFFTIDAGGPVVTGMTLLQPAAFFPSATAQEFTYGPPFDVPSLTPGRSAAFNSTSFNQPIGNTPVVFARLLVSTVGVLDGFYQLHLGNDLGLSAVAKAGVGGGDLHAALVDSELLLFPEPSTVVLGLSGLLSLAAVAIRKRRACRSAPATMSV